VPLLFLVQLIWTGRNPRSNGAPTDFIRTEWIRYVVDEEERLRQEVNNAISEIEGAATTFYRQIGDVALEALEPDLELAFERYKQVRERLAEAARARRADPGDDMASHRTRLLQSVSVFVGLLPS
jgi:hypothetical protein